MRQQYRIYSCYAWISAHCTLQPCLLLFLFGGIGVALRIHGISSLHCNMEINHLMSFQCQGYAMESYFLNFLKTIMLSNCKDENFEKENLQRFQFSLMILSFQWDDDEQKQPQSHEMGQQLLQTMSEIYWLTLQYSVKAVLSFYFLLIILALGFLSLLGMIGMLLTDAQYNYYWLFFTITTIHRYTASQKTIIIFYQQLSSIEFVVKLKNLQKLNKKQNFIENQKILMKSFKGQHKYQIEHNDIYSTPALMNKKQQFRSKTLNQLDGLMAYLEDDISQVNPNKVKFQRLKQKTEVSQSGSSWSKTHHTLNEIELANHSEIVKNISQLKIAMNLNRGFFDLKLLFRASQHNFDVRRFHQICSGVENTLVLAEVNNGNIFGGYTPLQWNDNYQTAGTHFKTDRSQQSFIFNYSTQEKYNLVKQTNNKAIIGCKYLGPTFGGYDFSIGNFANKKYSSTCDFPVSYSKQNKQKNTKLTRRSIIGLSQEAFLIKQWEVFEVIFKKKIQHQQNFGKPYPLDQKNQDLRNASTSKNFWNGILKIFI